MRKKRMFGGRVSALCLPVLLAFVAGGALSSTSASAAPGADNGSLKAQCDALKHLNIQSATESPANIVQTTFLSGQEATPREQQMFVRRGITQGIPVPKISAWPDHCRVEGYITPHVKFAMMLPAADKWNARFWFAACEGWCGSVNMDTMVPGLHHGFAVMTNDGGHYGARGFDAIWAYRNLDARINFAHRANHVSAEVGKVIIEAYYGDKPKYSYNAGFSKGGNAGLFAAQKYPEDFDGIFSMAPVVNYNPKNAAHMPWIAKAVHPDGKTPVIYSEKLDLIHGAATAACDTIDGLADGIIDDPRQCDFDPAILLCQAGQSEVNNECLNAAQVEAVQKIYAKPVSADGTVYFDYPNDIGSEMEWRGALLPVRGNSRLPAFFNGAITGHYMAFKDSPDASFDWMGFDYTQHTAEIAEMSEILDPDSLDLPAFKQRGGKLIVAHGWADGYISANMTLDWFEEMQSFMGGREATADFTQLYLLPGVHHGAGGPGPYIFDVHKILMKWVEEGVAPTKLLVEDGPEAETVRQRPVFPHPARAKYDGKGDPNKASSFVRVE